MVLLDPRPTLLISTSHKDVSLASDKPPKVELKPYKIWHFRPTVMCPQSLRPNRSDGFSVVWYLFGHILEWYWCWLWIVLWVTSLFVGMKQALFFDHFHSIVQRSDLWIITWFYFKLQKRWKSVWTFLGLLEEMLRKQVKPGFTNYQLRGLAKN